MNATVPKAVYVPTVEELEDQTAYLEDLLMTTRMHLRVARKRKAKKYEGPLLPLDFTAPEVPSPPTPPVAGASDAPPTPPHAESAPDCSAPPP